MGKALVIVNRAISTNLINKAGLRVLEAHMGAVTLIQRFGSALNLNLHYRMLFIDGVFSWVGSTPDVTITINALTADGMSVSGSYTGYLVEIPSQ